MRRYQAATGKDAILVETDETFERLAATQGARGGNRLGHCEKGRFCRRWRRSRVDPAKVVRCALQDASSIAGLLITTEAMVAEMPKKQPAAPAMPPGGGMGGMDF